MNDHRPLSPAHEELLRDLVLGEKDPRDPAVRAILESSPELSSAWNRQRATGQQLDRYRDLERTVLAGCDGHLPPEWEQRARETLRGAGAGDIAEPSGEGPRRENRPVGLSSWRGPALVAASLLFAFLALRFWVGSDAREGTGDSGGQAPTYLGDPSVAPVPLAPRGDLGAQSRVTFRWTYAPGDSWQGSCRVIAYDDLGDELLRSAPLVSPIEGNTWHWTPDANDLQILRAAGGFEWQVSASDANGSRASSASLSSSLD